MVVCEKYQLKIIGHVADAHSERIPFCGVCPLCGAWEGAFACATITTYAFAEDGSICVSVLGTILKDNFEWRKQVSRLSLFDLVKKSRGAVLSWAWFFIKPAMYIFCFWFALEVGLRVGGGGQAEGAPPYLIWLCAGLIPWFFMQEMFGQGSDVFHRYPYLVNKIKFPIAAIPTIFTGATLIVQLMLQAVLFIIYFLYGQPLTLYLLQVPLLLVLMFVFWTMFSLMISLLSALSKDVANLMKALSTPVFWLSGIIFDMSKIDIPVIQRIMDFNPVTFFAGSFRDAFYDHTWFWENPDKFIGFIVIFVLTLLVMVLVYRKFNEEVADAL